MDEQTTTDAPVDTGGNINGVAVDSEGRAVPEPEKTEPAAAVEETTEPEKKPVDEQIKSEPSEEEQLVKFAETKGLQLDSDNAKKAAKMAMEAEKRMHQATSRAGELEKTMTTMSDDSADQLAEQTGQDPEVLKRLQRMEVKDSIREFWDKNPEARKYEQEMAKIAVESGLYGSPEAILNASYAIAQSKNTDTVKSQAQRETLERLAQKQQAAVPTGNAVNSGSMTTATITPQNVDAMVANMSVEEYQRRLPEINAAMAG